MQDNKERCKKYYQQTKERQRARKLEYYHMIIQTDEGYQSIRKINLKANYKRRFGLDKESLYAILGNECAVCTNKKGLVIHHKDGNGRGSKNPNNDINNFALLCRSCHAKIHLQNEKLI